LHNLSFVQSVFIFKSFLVSKRAFVCRARFSFSNALGHTQRQYLQVGLQASALPSLISELTHPLSNDFRSGSNPP
jgi:hypothetical protein